MGELIVAVLAFVGSHELLSHPLRRPLVAVLGERGFLGLYSVMALGTLIWTIAAYRQTPVVMLWTAPRWTWDLASAVMLVASILFVGSILVRNPALPMAGGTMTADFAPQGVLRITRHPMMWAFALWAVVHAWLAGTLATLILAAGVAFLALFGSAMQDLKKAGQLGEGWAAYRARTSFLPFARGLAWPGWRAAIGGAMFFLGATWAHPRLFGAPVAGIWNYL